MTDLIKLADDYARAFVGALVTKDVLLRPKGAQNIEVARAALAAAIAAHDVRRAEELAAYELTVSNLRADAERYRWLRSRIPGGTYRIMGVVYSEGGAGVDAAIDAAMKAQPDHWANRAKELIEIFKDAPETKD